MSGERFFVRHPLTGQWSLSEPEPFISPPLHYQYAFGGECRIDKDNDAAGRVPDKYRLTPEQQAGHPQPDNPPVAHTACITNPSGRGFIERWYADTLRQSQFPAPRITDPRNPFTLDSFFALSGWTGGFCGGGVSASRIWFSGAELAATSGAGRNIRQALAGDRASRLTGGFWISATGMVRRRNSKFLTRHRGCVLRCRGCILMAISPFSFRQIKRLCCCVWAMVRWFRNGW